MLSFLRRTADANIARLNRLEAIEANWKDRFSQTRSDSVVHRLVSYAISKPVFTVGEVQKDLLEQARKRTMRVWAEQAPFDLKDALKRRGYRWSDGTDGRPRSWYVDVDESRLEDEIAFLNRRSTFGMLS